MPEPPVPGTATPPASPLRLDRLGPVAVEHAALRIVELPLRSPFTTSFGTQTVRRALLVECVSGGLTGVGECVAGTDPGYSAETVDTALGVLRDHILPGVVGKAPATVPDQLARVSWVRGHQMARAGLEMALLDLAGRAAGVSLGAVLGAARERVPCGVSIGIQPSLDATYALIDGYLGAGYRRIKLKCRPGYDVALARGVRQRFPEALVMLDANSAYRLEDLPTLRELDAFDLMMLEQPLAHDDLVDHAALQAQLRTPVCLDESVDSVPAARAAIQLRAGRIVNIKAGRVGGLVPAVRVHDLCRAAGWPVWCGGMLETGVGRAANVALAALPNFTLPGDTSASDRYFDADIITEPFRLRPDGTLPVPTGAGLGVELDPARLAATTQHHERVG